MTQRDQLRAIAAAAMRERGLDPDFPAAALSEVAAMTGPPVRTEEPVRNLVDLLWCSIDNDDSRDLDQLPAAVRAADGAVRILVAVADVDAAVPRGSACDRHAAENTTSVYTPAQVFPMLPERLSTDLTSLNQDEDRLAIVIEVAVTTDGSINGSDVYGAPVRNRAKLAYNSVGAWLEGTGPLPDVAARVKGLDDQLRIQDRAAQALARVRHEHGALEFESLEVHHVFDGDTLHDVRPERPNRA